MSTINTLTRAVEQVHEDLEAARDSVKALTDRWESTNEELQQVREALGDRSSVYLPSVVRLMVEELGRLRREAQPVLDAGVAGQPTPNIPLRVAAGAHRLGVELGLDPVMVNAALEQWAVDNASKAGASQEQRTEKVADLYRCAAMTAGVEPAVVDTTVVLWKAAERKQREAS